jgi:chorismate--pyruvate lyase
LKRWRRQAARIAAPPALRAWLAAPGSLTARLVAHSQRFEVRLLRQAKARCLADQRALLRMRHGPVIAREVLLCCDGVPVVYAQTVLPAAQARSWPLLRGLGARSLGSKLFADARIAAGELQHARLAPGDALARRARAALTKLPAQARIPARRRLYRRGGNSLLVTELFLPAIAELEQRNEQAGASHASDHAKSAIEHHMTTGCD